MISSIDFMNHMVWCDLLWELSGFGNWFAWLLAKEWLAIMYLNCSEVQWWFVNPGPDNPEISLLWTKSVGTDFYVWTNGWFSNPENSFIRKYRLGINRIITVHVLLGMMCLYIMQETTALTTPPAPRGPTTLWRCWWPNQNVNIVTGASTATCPGCTTTLGRVHPGITVNRASIHPRPATTTQDLEVCSDFVIIMHETEFFLLHNMLLHYLKWYLI